MLSDFQFDLRPELIAQVPAEQRDQGRLLALDRRTGTSTHTHVHALPEHLQPGDLLVVNDTRVMPARLFGRTPSGGAVELLLICPTVPPAGSVPVPPAYADPAENAWVCLGKPAKRLRAGTPLSLGNGTPATVSAVHGDGRYTVAFPQHTDVCVLLEREGEIPLPPYIQRPDGPLPLDRHRYQTIFAATPGAVAAPTAGLHFTPALVAALHTRAIGIASVTLHVGPGTFLPIRTEAVGRHVMDPEWCNVPPATAVAIRRVKSAGGRVVAVGTSTTRALESAACGNGGVQPGARWADRFIVPGYQFRVIDALFTNLHLPGSTLLLLVSALAGRERILATYADAMRRGYRFYSYGDAMLIQ